MNTDFDNKVVFITGASNGIGRGCANYFLSNGASVYLVDIDESKGRELISKGIDSGLDISFRKCDVSNKSEVEQAVASCLNQYGKLDIAVNNAGIGGSYGPVEEMKEEDFNQLVDVNVAGVFFCMQAQIKAMKRTHSGSIINIASMAGLIGAPFTAAYCASKHAVVGMTKSAALENAKSRIRINAVCPAYVRTNMVEKLISVHDTMEQKLQKAIPMKRFGLVKEVVDAIGFLASDLSSFNTGLCLPVDGGLIAR